MATKITDSLVKKVIADRTATPKVSWPEIWEKYDLLGSQTNAIRARMRELSPDSIQNSGPNPGGGTTKVKKNSKKTAAKKTAAKKSSKKTAAKKRPRRVARKTDAA